MNTPGADEPLAGPARSILITSPEVGEGGMSRMIEDFASASIDDGHRIGVRFPPSDAGRSLTRRIKQLGGEDLGNGDLSRSGLKSAVDSFKADWILIVTGAFPPSTRVGRMAMGLGVPVLETLRGMPRRLNVSLTQKLFYTMRGSDRYRVLVINQDMHDACVNIGGAIAKATRRVPNGVRLPLAATKQNRDGPLRLVSHSRLNESQKDHATTLRAMTHIDESITLSLLGDGPDRDSLEQLARELGVFKRVRFEGQVENVFRRLGEFDVEILSTKREGLPRVAVEAMAVGLPVIGSDVSGVRDMVNDGSNGALVPPSDPAALAQRVAEFDADRGLLRRLGDQAKADAKQHDHVRTARVIRSIAEEFLSPRG